MRIYTEYQITSFYEYFQVIPQKQTLHPNWKQPKNIPANDSAGREEEIKTIDEKQLGKSECTSVSDEDSFESELRKPPARREIGEVKRVADQLRKISRPETEIVLHPKPR